MVSNSNQFVLSTQGSSSLYYTNSDINNIVVSNNGSTNKTKKETMKLFKNNLKVPKFQKMDCYFQKPFLGYFGTYKYAIIRALPKDEYMLCIYDQNQNFGSIQSDPNSPYQADEIYFTSLNDLTSELRNIFTDDMVELTIRMIPKLRYYMSTIGKLVADDDVYLVENDRFITKKNLSPYIAKGTIVELIDGCYIAEDGEDVPEDQMTVSTII